MKKINLKSELIFVVDDDEISLTIYENVLLKHGYERVQSYDNPKSCLSNLHQLPTVIFLDYNFRETINGVDVLSQIKKNYPDIQVVLLSGQEELEVAIEALTLGAFDYIVKNDEAPQNMLESLDRITLFKDLLQREVNAIDPIGKSIQTLSKVFALMIGVMVISAFYFIQRG